MNSNAVLQQADVIAKKMVNTLLCPACKDACLRTDGSVKGRLRLVCMHCRKTLYADKHPLIVDILSVTGASSRDNTSSDIRPSVATPALQDRKSVQIATPTNEQGSTKASTQSTKASTQSTRPSTLEPEAEYLSDDSSYPSLCEARTSLIPMQSPSRSTQYEIMSDNDDPMYLDDDMIGIQDEINLRNQEEIENLKDHIASLNNYAKESKADMKEVKGTIMKLNDTLLKLLPLIQNNLVNASSKTLQSADMSNALATKSQYESTGSQYHSTIAQYHPDTGANDASVQESPWLVAARKGKAIKQVAQNRNLNHTNRYKELAEVIPAYHKLSESTEPGTLGSSMYTKPRAPKYRQMTADDIERVKQGKPLRPRSSMVNLYFEGFRRNRPTDVKNTFKCIGIPLGSVRNISFIGSSIMELLTFNDAKDLIIEKLASIKVTNLANFDPLSIENIKNTNKFPKVITDEDKKALAKKLYISRLKKSLERLPTDPRNNRLRNYYTLLIRNAEKGESTVPSTPTIDTALTAVPPATADTDIPSIGADVQPTIEPVTVDVSMDDVTKKRKDRSDDESQEILELANIRNVDSA
jgi:hypothetical protein